MAESNTKAKVKVAIDIRLGQGTPNQRRLWAKFWQKLISEVKASEW